jgi:hypothetical protein
LLAREKSSVLFLFWAEKNQIKQMQLIYKEKGTGNEMGFHCWMRKEKLVITFTKKKRRTRTILTLSLPHSP